MPSFYGRHFAMLLILFACVSSSHAQAGPPALTAGELISLVAGGTLPENVVHQIELRGISFRPDDTYRSLLVTAGGKPGVLLALKNATFEGPAQSANVAAPDSAVPHLAAAGQMMRGADYEGAARELGAALDTGDHTEAGFVMGELLREQERWPEAYELYSEILRQDPDFPGVHTKLSYVVHRAGDQEEALREAMAGLKQYKDDSEAHKNAGLALQTLRKFTASEQEYNEALRIKPDYAAARGDLGLLYYAQEQSDRSIVEFKKAIALDSEYADWPYDLGLAYEDTGDIDSAIRQYRQAKRLNPKMFDSRQALGKALMARNMYAEAVLEFRELEAIAPNSVVCHDCLATALFKTRDMQGAENEFQEAAKLDPSDPLAHLGLGNIRQEAKNYDGALQEYRVAERLDDSYAPIHREAGKVLLAQKDVQHALEELKRAEDLAPLNGETHFLCAQGLEASGDDRSAIAELDHAISLLPKDTAVRLELAATLERSGDWSDALIQYRQLAQDDPSDYGQNQYRSAQDRIEKRIASTKAAGNPSEAKQLKSDLKVVKAAPGISEQLNSAMRAGVKANAERYFDEAEKHYKDAVELAGKLQPHDDRLTTSLLHLADLYAGRSDFALAASTYQQGLKTTEELYGPQSPMIVGPLQALGGLSLMKQDYRSALDFYSRAVEVNEKTFGDTSDKVAQSLVYLAVVPLLQNDYQKAESYLLRATSIDESLYGKDGDGMLVPLASLCSLYEKWDKPDKTEPCDRQMLAAAEKQFGANSPVIVPALSSDAHALRLLGREAEAVQVEQRMQSLQAATTAPSR